MALYITPNATREAKVQRVRDNLEWLQKRLLDDKEDRNALQAFLRQLPE